MGPAPRGVLVLLRTRRESAEGSAVAWRSPARAAPGTAPAYRVGRRRADARPRLGSAVPIQRPRRHRHRHHAVPHVARPRELLRLATLVSRVPALAATTTGGGARPLRRRRARGLNA